MMAIVALVAKLILWFVMLHFGFVVTFLSYHKDREERIHFMQIALPILAGLILAVLSGWITY